MYVCTCYTYACDGNYVLPVPPHMQVVTLNSVHSSSPAEDSATTWALPPTLDATNITNTSVMLTAAFPDLATPLQQIVLQQVRVCIVLYVIMAVGREGDSLKHHTSALTIVVQLQRVWSGQTQQVFCPLTKCKQANQTAETGSCG